ncbi:MAG: hypothetical protein K9N35_03795 [Candidatus Marinimicrobia bacterium]|nr:hypothetical protein [Candidatus Neomarinimicrobiota bacterium]
MQIFFTLSILNPDKVRSYRLAVFLAVGYIIYEILQTILPRGTFDWMDILGTLYGLGISILILSLLWRLNVSQY